MPPVSYLEADPLDLQPGHQLNDMAQRAADAVELPNHERIVPTELIKCPGKAGAFGDGAAAGVLVQALAAGRLQGVALQCQVLLGRGHAHVADQHRATHTFAETYQSSV